MPIIRYLEVTIGRDSVELDTFKKFKQNLVLNLDTIMRFTQNDLFRRTDDQLAKHLKGNREVMVWSLYQLSDKLFPLSRQ